MKHSLLLTLLSACFLTGMAQQRADRQSLNDPNSFSFILMGDPQGYTKYDVNQPLFELCTAWCADNIDHLNTKAVLLTGDLVEQNENYVPIPRISNQTSKQMWEWASHCMKRLDNRVPYIISTGNHEYGYVRGDEGFTHFPEYFPMERNSKWKNCVVATYPNREGKVSLEDAAYAFHEKTWGDILVIALEWAPRDEVLEWAKKLAADKKYKDYKVFVITHSFLKGRTAERTANENYKIKPANYGKDIWEKLIFPSSNIRLVICGHTGQPGSFEDNVAYRCDKNTANKSVHQMMFNVQCLGGGWEGNGGDGWLRILEFNPDGKTISVRTYSPLFGISSTTKQFAHRKGKCDEFDIKID
ncbi:MULTISPECIES: metallophosphoesterase [unclassified Prevotella]|uniref:metallophosphoesterase n=1 Tax=unclassified Prevotella TaxID=2638335 RepID=UPI0005147FDC|nr:MULTISPECIES: metallophosphoesterase [unclassified Prevotella]KGI61348.1 serine/threonine protein phosphatase [Prevotella sp. S7 MS 2]